LFFAFEFVELDYEVVDGNQVVDFVEGDESLEERLLGDEEGEDADFVEAAKYFDGGYFVLGFLEG
jgi:hypothetical protein